MVFICSCHFRDVFFLLPLTLLAVHAKSIVAILHLLVALSQHFRAPIRLPDHVSIQVVVVQVGFFKLHFCKAFLAWVYSHNMLFIEIFGFITPFCEFMFGPTSIRSSFLCVSLSEKRGNPPVPANSRGNHRQHGVSLPAWLISTPPLLVWRHWGRTMLIKKMSVSRSIKKRLSEMASNLQPRFLITRPLRCLCLFFLFARWGNLRCLI